MNKGIYTWTRDLHLYFGLFVSPFVLVFGISTIFLNHALVPQGSTVVEAESRKSSVRIQVPPGLEGSQGMQTVEKAREIMRQVGVSGEVSFIRHLLKENRLVIPVMKPGWQITINTDLANHQATIEQRRTGVWDALIYLHRSPGQHNANIRGNWFYTRLWAWFADGSVYLFLFISSSGIYLWLMIKAERKIGFALLGAGTFSFLGAVYALCI